MPRITRYEPWSLMSQLHDEMSKFFDTPLSRRLDEGMLGEGEWTPQVDVLEEADRFLIKADVPGVEPSQIEVHAENGVLTIRGHRESEHKEEDKDKGYHRLERFSGSFLRRFSLPDNVDAENITAQGKHGVLEIRLPKRSKAEGRKIQVEQA